VSGVQLSAAPLTGNNARSTSNFDVAILYERQIDVAAERERLTKEIAKYTKGLESAQKQLSSESFLAKAPAPIVEGLKKQAAETAALLKKAQDGLDDLPPA
jgi:valyl-tRNA synthetase